MADKPSRGLVIVGDGLARFVNPSHAHLHSFASKACCGFLSLPNAPLSEKEDDRVVRELLHLVDSYEENMKLSVIMTEDSSVPAISERFMGDRSAIVTDNSNLKSLGGKLGFSVLQFNELTKGSSSNLDSNVGNMALELLKLLGFEEGKTLETCQFDLVFVHMGACEEFNGGNMEFLNAFLGEMMRVNQLQPDVASRLHLSLVMGYGAVSEDDGTIFSISDINQSNTKFSSLYPRQSYTMKGSDVRMNVRQHCPMLIAQWQDAVTRKDNVETFSFNDFKEHGANLTIPADRFLHEVAFKLWKSPKYGA